MRVRLEDAADVKRAREFVSGAIGGELSGALKPAFVSHALLIEAMLKLGCSDKRAEMLADGLYTIAIADQKQFVVHGFSDAVMAVAMGEHRRDPLLGGRLKLMAGVAAVS